MLQRAVLVLWIGILPLAIGCSDGLKLAKVTGKVTYKNQPLAGANVKFHPPTGPAAVGITDENGVFTLNTNGRAGATVGMNKVSITKMTEGTAKTNTSMTPEDMRKMAMSNMKKENTGPKSVIPAKYGDPDNGTLSADVAADSSQNDFVFDLQDLK